MNSVTELEKEVKRLITLYSSLHGITGFTAYDITEDIMRQYNYLNRVSVLELTKHLLKEDK